MRFLSLVGLSGALASSLWSQDVGSGAPSEAIRQRFIDAFFRNGFFNKVSLPPAGNVRSFGSTGLVQEFPDATTSSVRWALVKANTSNSLPSQPSGQDTAPLDVFQVWAPMYTYYSSVGAGTAGFPAIDTRNCPNSSGACQYQLFDKNYALFAHQQANLNGQNFATRDPFYTKWVAAGGISVIGPADSAETNVTSVKGATGVRQTFLLGAIYRVTSGANNGRIFAIPEPVYSVFVSNGGETGFLGFPISDDLVLPDGSRRMSFEGGSIDFNPGGGATVRYPVGSISVSPAGSPVRMQLGDTLTLAATIFAPTGQPLADRAVSWSTSNGRVVSLQAAGASVTLRAVGGGIAVISATSEGKSATPITVIVTAPCCQVGEGAPSAGVQQSFEDAVTRNRLSLKLPTSNPVRRAGAGYLQEFVAADSSVRYVLAKPDRVPTAYVLAGAILSRWEELGAAAGPIGYPLADATPGGRQLFENAALAGTPVRVVSGGVLAKWAALGYETGPAGPPSAEAAPFVSFTGAGGSAQAFLDSGIYAATAGPQAGRAFLVRGAIFAKYASLQGVAGLLGMPLSDEFLIDGRLHQDFEGGEIEQQPGESEPRVLPRERRPLVTATPAVITPGGRVRLVAGGFEPGATLRVTVTGEPEFSVRAETGAYAWEMAIAAAARSGTVVVRAVAGSAEAEGSFQIRAASEQRIELKKARGDAQVGLPGAMLPQPLRVAIRDEAGNPVAGAAVRFTASPGAQVGAASVITGAGGEAETTLRLPAADGASLVTAEAYRQVVTFSALATPASLPNFPKLAQAGEKGALVAAAASIVRHYQNLGNLPAPSGLADPAAVNDYLKNRCSLDAKGNEICDGFLPAPGSGEPVANLWRLAGFVAGNLEVSPEKTDPATLRDLLAQGAPVLLALALSSGDQAMGAHFVVAIGVRADGGIQIHDPNPLFGRSTLGEYLSGFPAGSRAWKGVITSALRLVPRTASPTGFVVTGGAAPIELSGPAGPCGATVEWPGAAATGQPPSAAPGSFRARYCDGVQPVYQLDVLTEDAYQLAVTDLGSLGGRFELAGRGAAAFRLARASGPLAVTPQQVSFEAKGVVNAASFSSAMAPGGLIAVFGNGLSRPGGKTTIEINGISSPILGISPFQVNGQVPPALPPGTYPLRIRSPYGTAEQNITVQAVAPAIFILEGGRGAIVNQDGSLNSPGAPARRGQVVTIYCTGLGAVTEVGSLFTASTSVLVVLGDLEVPVDFAGLTPGFIGLYQVNLPIPPSMPPRLDASLALRQDTARSNLVSLAVQ